MEWSGVAGSVTSAAEEALFGVRNAGVTLRAGFTTVRDVGTFRAFVDVALRDAIEAGWVAGPADAVRRRVHHAPRRRRRGDRPRPRLRRSRTTCASASCATPVDVREKVRAIVGGGADLIKVIATGAVLARGTRARRRSSWTRPMLRAAVEEADRQGVFVAAHAHGAEGIKVAIRAGVRSIEHGSLIDDEGIDAARPATAPGSSPTSTDGDWIAGEGAPGGLAGRGRWPRTRPTTEAQRDGLRARPSRPAPGSPSGPTAGSTRTARNADPARLPGPARARRRSTPIRSATIWRRRAAWAGRTASGRSRPGRFADLVAVGADPAARRRGRCGRPSAVVKGGALVPAG